MQADKDLSAQERLLRRSLQSRMFGAAGDVHVDIEPNGRIVLSGHAASFYEKQLAQEAVVELPGVLQVENRIEVN